MFVDTHSIKLPNKSKSIVGHTCSADLPRLDIDKLINDYITENNLNIPAAPVLQPTNKPITGNSANNARRAAISSSPLMPITSQKPANREALGIISNPKSAQSEVGQTVPNEMPGGVAEKSSPARTPTELLRKQNNKRQHLMRKFLRKKHTASMQIEAKREKVEAAQEGQKTTRADLAESTRKLNEHQANLKAKPDSKTRKRLIAAVKRATARLDSYNAEYDKAFAALKETERTAQDKDFVSVYCGCARIPTFKSITQGFNPETGRGSMEGLCDCDNPWICPHSAILLGNERKQLFDAIIAAMKALGYRAIMLTLTMRHKLSDKLDPMLDALKGAHAALYGGRAGKRILAKIGYAGGIFITEILWGIIAGWHPHNHDLLFVPEETLDEEIEAVKDELVRLWAHLLKKHGYSCTKEHGVHILTEMGDISDYILKFGKPPKAETWTGGSELGKLSSKVGSDKSGRPALLHPFQLLDLSKGNIHSHAAKLFVEYAQATFGRQQMDISNPLRKMLDIKAIKAGLNEQAALESEKVKPVGAWYPDNFERILAYDEQGFKALDEQGEIDKGRSIDPYAFRPHLQSIVEQYCSRKDTSLEQARLLINGAVRIYGLYLAQVGEFDACLGDERLPVANPEFATKHQKEAQAANAYLRDWNAGPPGAHFSGDRPRPESVTLPPLDESLINLRF